MPSSLSRKVVPDSWACCQNTPSSWSKLARHHLIDGLLHVVICGVHYLVTHLTPVDAASREKETAVLAEMVSATLEALVLMGDMNTLSLLDQEEHATSGLVDVLRRDLALRRKFLTSDQNINYRPMQQLLEAGLRDLGATVQVAYSVPTAAIGTKPTLPECAWITS